MAQTQTWMRSRARARVQCIAATYWGVVPRRVRVTASAELLGIGMSLALLVMSARKARNKGGSDERAADDSGAGRFFILF